MKAAICLCIACVCLCATGRAQDLSTVELPSEDEIYEALLSGEIDYDQFVQLLEVVQEGIDSSNVHLLDLILTMLFFEHDSAASQSEPGEEETSATVKYSFYQSLQEPLQSRYNTSVKSRFNRQWDVSLKLRRDLSGAERLTGRSATYHDSSRFIQEVSIGSLSKRLGLGTVFGNHNKLLKGKREFSGENFAYPDCSGQNGFYAKAVTRSFSIKPLISLHRDSEYSLVTGGSGFGLVHNGLSTTLILGSTRVHNRHTGLSVTDYKAALNIGSISKKNPWAVEYAVQAGHKKDYGTIVFNASHRWTALELQATGWIYGDNYLDLTGGSKTASLSRTASLPELGFSFTDRRSGQEGGLVRAKLDLANNLGLSNSLLAASRNQDTCSTQWLSQLDYRSSKKLVLSASMLIKQNERVLSKTTERRIRAGAKYAAGRLSCRTYIGHAVRSANPGYFFWLSDVRAKLSPDTKVQVWSNLGRMVKGSVDYWYLFVRTEHRLFDQVRFSTKLMHRYDRTATHRRQLAIGLEVAAGL